MSESQRSQMLLRQSGGKGRGGNRRNTLVPDLLAENRFAQLANSPKEEVPQPRNATRQQCDCTSYQRPISPVRKVKLSGCELSLSAHGPPGFRHFDGITRHFSAEDGCQDGECPLSLCVCLAFSDTRSLEFLNPALKPISVHLAQPIS